jgi:amidohydrolase
MRGSDLERVSGPVVNFNPQTVAEDFSYYANETPGLFVFLGNGPADVDPATLPTNHSPYFDMQEPNLEIGVRVFSNLVVDYLQD